MYHGIENSISIEGREIISDLKNSLLNIIFFGLLNFICKLFPNMEIILKTVSCPLDIANCVVVNDHYGNRKIFKIQKIKVKPTRALKRYTKNGYSRIFNTQFGRFIYDFSLDKFVLPKFTKSENTNILENQMSVYERKIIFGQNHIELNIRSAFEIIIDNVIEPFFIWELFSLIIWIAVQYYKYAVVVGTLYFIMLLINIVEDMRKNKILRESVVVSDVQVLRDGSFKLVPEWEILPGDMIYISPTDSFSCDTEILKGSVIVDESFLTGESVPICKGPGSMVYSGTRIIKSICTSVPLNSKDMKNLVKTKSLTSKKSQNFNSKLNIQTITDIFNNENSSEVSDQNKNDNISAIGLVLKTGQRTRRNSLLTNLSFKKPVKNEFLIESAVVIKYLVTSAFLLMSSFVIYFYKTLPFSTNLEYSSDIALTFFSPALYTCLQLGIQHARNELLKKEVNTTEISRINTAGEVDMVIFDKTGTLTELGVDILCFDTIEQSYEKIDDIGINIRMALSTCHYVVELDDQYSGDVIDMKMFLFSQSKIINKDNRRYIEMEVKRDYKPICKEYSKEESTGKLDESMLYLGTDNANSFNDHSDEQYSDTPHGYNKLNSMGEDRLEANPIEVMNDNLRIEHTLEILRIYDFDIYLKRISVVVKDHTGKIYLFCKGAPDSVKKTLKSIPDTYVDRVRDYGLEGYRVLTVAMKEITEYGNRVSDETDLEFLGFLVLANKLKEETCDVIKELKEANLNPKMCTGDGILTAICVAKECGMIDPATPVLFPVLEEGCKSCYDVEWYSTSDEHFIFDKYRMLLHTESDKETQLDFVVAVEGKEFEYFKSSQYYQLILEKGVVFARFNPDNKKELIECYSKEGYVTMFCGDGANDTGALCSADVGLSLATNEASLAASFNSKYLSSVLDIIKEGRSALSMSAAQFKYILYSQILAGFQMLALFPYRLFPSDGMSLINDLLSCYILGYSLSTFKASNKISPIKYKADILRDSFIILQELIIILNIYVFCGFYINDEEITIDIQTRSKKSTLVFLTTMILLIIKAFEFGNFKSYRASRIKNLKFLIIICCSVVGFVVILISFLKKFKPIFDFFDLVEFNKKDKCVLFICMAISLLVTILPFKKIFYR